MKIYNLNTRNSNQRFYKSILYGLLTGIVCAVLFSEFVKLTNITFTFFYLITGYAIAQSIQKAGGGLGVKYSYLGAALTAFSFLLTQLFIYFGYELLTMPQTWLDCLIFVLKDLVSMNGHALITLVLMAFGIYIGFTYSNITKD